jgi:hypothetical protein
MMTEQEAATRWCPQQADRRQTCIGDKCMAWRWHRAVEDKLDSKGRRTGRQTITPTGKGWCGLAGKPDDR